MRTATPSNGRVTDHAERGRPVTPRMLCVLVAVLTILLAGGCGGVSDETYAELEQQRDAVLTWARDLSKVASTTLAASPEDATESYDGVDRSGLSGQFTSYTYGTQAMFITELQDPLAGLSGDLEAYGPTASGTTLRLSSGDMTAIFRTYPKGPGKVGLFVEGTPVEIDDEEIRDWAGYVVGEPVELQ